MQRDQHILNYSEWIISFETIYDLHIQFTQYKSDLAWKIPPFLILTFLHDWFEADWETKQTDLDAVL